MVSTRASNEARSPTRSINDQSITKQNFSLNHERNRASQVLGGFWVACVCAGSSVACAATDEFLQRIFCYRCLIPFNSYPGPIRHDQLTILELKRVFKNRICPILPFQPVRRVRHAE